MKIITDKELADLIERVVNGDTDAPEWIDEAATYRAFLTDLAELATNYFGGIANIATFDPCDALGWTVAIQLSDDVPDDGGIWAKYDTDATWKNGKEEQ
jgi:hypothetical protein